MRRLRPTLHRQASLENALAAVRFSVIPDLTTPPCFRGYKRTALISILALTVSSTSAWAQLNYRELITFPDQIASNSPHDRPETHRFNTVGPGGGAGLAAITFASTPAPYVYATATATASSTAVAGELQYDISVTGPALSYVPIRFRGNFDLAIDSSFAGAYVGFGLQLGAGGIGSQSVSFDTRCDGSSIMSRCIASTWLGGVPENLSSIAFVSEPSAGNANLGTGLRGSFSGSLMAPTDADGISRGLVSLFANAGTVGGFGGGTTWAYIDPEFLVDAAYLAEHPETLLSLPSGVGNDVATRPVPEPGAAGLMAGGLAALLLALRRRPSAGKP